ncbi:MAG TPA: NTP transferase domain-containing protein [Candidatus Eisenbergiella intestinipullorum]|nr:NTP transferase domain-containing protein [Candidatus Eisenbergiella intestinipullorum]
MEKIYGVVMAGGGGTRLWPLSTSKKPKQFLNLSGKETLVNEAIDRLAGVAQELFIVTNAAQAQEMLEQTAGRVPQDHILKEPAARNTAACIGYAAMTIMKKYGDGIMIVVPSDPYIRDEEGFCRTLREAAAAAEETDALVTVGIRPTFPSTGYGYIKNTALEGKIWRRVEEFVEKPDEETAKRYVKEGYVWNSGMFIWRASTILSWFERLLPDIYACLERLAEGFGTKDEESILWEVYPKIPKISVDYGIMERAEHVLMVPGDFGWSDVGGWDAFDALKERDENGNITVGKTLLLDSRGCTAYSVDRLIAAVGVEDLIIVQAGESVLVCPASQAQRVKEIVETLAGKGETDYL